MQEYITIRSVLRCIDLSFPSSLTLLGMQIVEKLSATLEFQEMYASLPSLLFSSPLFFPSPTSHLYLFQSSHNFCRLFRCGVHFYLLPIILQPVIMFAKQNANDPLARYPNVTPLPLSLFLPLFSFVLFLTRSVMRGQR